MALSPSEKYWGGSVVTDELGRMVVVSEGETVGPLEGGEKYWGGSRATDPYGRTVAVGPGGQPLGADSAQAGGLSSLLKTISPLTGDLAVGLLPNGNDFQLLYGWGGGRYWQSILRKEEANPGSLPLNQLQAHADAVPMLSKAFGDASVTLEGTWTEGTNAAAYGGKYKYATASTAKAKITTPSCNRIGIRLPVFTNGGGPFRVSIDGSFSKANLLPTAAQGVASGAYPNTILVANGGICEPTDRILDAYGATAPDTPTAIADETSLSTATHEVVLQAVGVNRSVGGAARAYFAGYSYATTGTTTPTTANVAMHAAQNLNTSQGSAHEYALKTGGTFFGSVHGYEEQVSLEVAVDGVAKTLAAGEIVSAQEAVDITRKTKLLNPAVPAEVLATVTTVYHLDRVGLRVTPTIKWEKAITLEAAYAMFPLNSPKWGTGGLCSTADVLFTGGNMLNSGLGPFTFSASGTTFGKAKSSAAWIYGTSPATNVGYCGVQWMPAVNELVNGWKQSAPVYTGIEDRSAASPSVTKIYMERIGSEGSETVAVGQEWTWRTRYLIGRLPAGTGAVSG